MCTWFVINIDLIKNRLTNLGLILTKRIYFIPYRWAHPPRGIIGIHKARLQINKQQNIYIFLHNSIPDFIFEKEILQLIGKPLFNI